MSTCANARRRWLLGSATPRTTAAGFFSTVLLLAACAPADDGITSEDVLPEGRWHVAPRDGQARGESPNGEEDLTDQQRAQLLSLPYLSGSRTATAQDRGVVAWADDHSWGRHNLYTSGHGPDVLLLYSDGTPVHRWRMPFERAFPGQPTSAETPFFRRAHVLPGGHLIAIYQGGGMVRLDAESQVQWAAPGGFFNDFFVTEDDEVWAVVKEARSLPDVRDGEEILEDKLRLLDAVTGEAHRELSILRLLLASRFRDVLEPLGETADILHSNTVQVLGAEAEGHPLFAPGQLLISMREISTVAVLDPLAETVVWAQRGPWHMQHEPTLQTNGNILLFDNRGGSGGRARVVEVDPTTGEITFELDGFVSPEAGTVARLANGNLLVTESERGRAVEITPAGEIAWEFRSPHRAGRNDDLVATLFEIVRLTDDQVAFFLDE